MFQGAGPAAMGGGVGSGSSSSAVADAAAAAANPAVTPEAGQPAAVQPEAVPLQPSVGVEEGSGQAAVSHLDQYDTPSQFPSYGTGC